MDLVIVTTPFQSLIVQELIKRNIVTDFDIFFYCDDTEQNKYYFSNLKNKAKKAYFYSQKKDSFKKKWLITIYHLFYNTKYNTIFLASIEKLVMHLILSLVNSKKIATFDDGTINISYTSPYHRTNKPTLLRRSFNYVLGNRYSADRIKNESFVHYTIFKDKKNIISNTKYIQLFLYNDEPIKGDCGEINVVIGTVCSEITDAPEIFVQQLSYFIKKNNCCYIKHPRCKYEINDINILDGIELAEFKILKLLSIYEKVNVYGFYSTAQINLNEISGIKNYLLTSKLINKKIVFDFGFEEVALDY